MLRNYLKVTTRNLLKQKGYTFINVAGLAIGLTCCLLILLFVRDELSYDRFHEHAEAVHRVALHRQFPNREVTFATTPPALGAALVNDYPEAVEATRLFKPNASVSVRRGDIVFNEERLFFADSNYFNVFTLPLIQGDAQAALRQANAVIVTQTTAARYFGANDPIGQMLTFDGLGDFLVTGVAQDSPHNTHLKFDFLASFMSLDLSRSTSWATYPVYTYVLLQAGTARAPLEAKLPEMVRNYASAQVEQFLGISFDEYLASGNRYDFILQPITDIHLTSYFVNEAEPNSNIIYVYLFAVIAAFILLIACINFTNLSTARSARRAKEVGMRKVLGSERAQLILQFLAESVLQSLVALALALGLITLILPFFNTIAETQITVRYLAEPWLLPATVGFAILVGVVAGSYPAFYLSRLRPSVVLKGGGLRRRGRSLLRDGLVVFQFMISITLIASTAVVYLQIDYMLNKTLGFDKEHVVILERAQAVGDQGEAFRQSLLANADITRVAISNLVPGRPLSNSTFEVRESPIHDRLLMATLAVDEDFVQTMGIDIVRGRDFSRDFPADRTEAVLINETAARAIGWEEPIGKQLNVLTGDPLTVVGVVKDFHFESLHSEIGPLVLFDSAMNSGGPRLVSIRVQAEDMPGTLAEIEQVWQQFAPEQPFAFSFLDRDFAALYEAEATTGQLFAIFSTLAILIACLGLFGLASFTTEQRIKEIGVRKVLGATVSSIFLLLSKHFALLVAIAFVVAAPIAYLAMDWWLQGFAHHIDVGLSLLFLAGFLALGVAWLTVSYQAVKAARANPVEALRYE